MSEADRDMVGANQLDRVVNLLGIFVGGRNQRLERGSSFQLPRERQVPPNSLSNIAMYSPWSPALRGWLGS
jgi:hypothetical protein